MLPPTDSLRSLYRRAATADSIAIEVLIATLPCLDGGELGDALRAFGESFDHQPARFARAVRTHPSLETRAADILMMLPLELTDLSAQQEQLLCRRYTIITQDSTLGLAQHASAVREHALRIRRIRVRDAQPNDAC